MERDEEGAFGVVPDEDLPDRPRVVDEAHEVLTAYSWKLTGTGVAAAFGFFASGVMGDSDFLAVLALMLTVLLLLHFVPITREPRLAREVLRRWDRLRVERALESSGVSADPRLEVAESMADRVLRHPSVDARVREAVVVLLGKLRLALRDLSRVRYLTEARVTLSQGHSNRSISDLQDLLDARVAEVLGQLAELHSTVVLRDATSLERVMGRVEELIYELEAEREVERLLTDAEQT